MQKLCQMTTALLLSALTLPAVAGILDAAALRERALHYEHGSGSDRNYQHAHSLYCLATRMGDSEAAYRLGWMHLNGRGVSYNSARAIGWFQLAADRGDRHSRNVLDELLTNGTPEADPRCPLDSAAPDQALIQSWVQALAPGYDIEPELVLAMIEVESRFNSRARSPKNARGLMQLMPFTAKRFGVRDVWDPAENLMGGMAYLRWLLNRYELDIGLSLAAYNAGEHAVDRYGGIPPYRETRHYVKNIQRIYRNLQDS